MANNNFKLDRLAETIKYAVNEIINEEIDSLNFVTITDVVITKDLVDAKIYYQTLDVKDEKKTQQKLQQKASYIRKRLASEVKMRRVPNLIFKYDHSLDNYNRIDEILRDV